MVGVCQRVFNWPQQERERRAELVTHVAEKDCFSAVQFSQRIGLGPCFLVDANVSNCGGHLAGNECEKPLVMLVELQYRADTCYE